MMDQGRPRGRSDNDIAHADLARPLVATRRSMYHHGNRNCCHSKANMAGENVAIFCWSQLWGARMKNLRERHRHGDVTVVVPLPLLSLSELFEVTLVVWETSATANFLVLLSQCVKYMYCTNKLNKFTPTLSQHSLSPNCMVCSQASNNELAYKY